MKAHGKKAYEYCLGGKPEWELDIHIIEAKNGDVLHEVEIASVHTEDEAMDILRKIPGWNLKNVRVLVHYNLDANAATNESCFTANEYITIMEA